MAEGDEVLARMRRSLQWDMQQAYGQRLWGGPRISSDPNPMPRFDWWPSLDRPRQLRDEIRSRLTGAWYVLRHGAPVDWDGW